MVLKDLFKKEPEEYVELEFEENESKEGKLMVKIEKLNSFSDTGKIQESVRDGNVLLVKIRDLRKKDIGELKRAVAKIRKTCLAIDGDIAGVGEDWLLVTPKTAKIHRDDEE
jgi:uncharacterized protein